MEQNIDAITPLTPALKHNGFWLKFNDLRRHRIVFYDNKEVFQRY